jgi:peptide/nickel transport system permease protein
MAQFLIRRSAGLVATLLGVSFVVFWVMNVLPGDPALVILGIESTPQAQESLRRELGLDRPFLERYAAWLLGMVLGDFGTSYAFRLPVAQLVAERMPLTLSLAASGMMLTVAMALGLGVLAASSHRRPADWAVMLASQLGIAIPAFWLSILLVIVFAVNLRWLPPGGFPGWSDPAAAIRALILPTIALAVVQAAVLARVTRSALLEVSRLDFVRTARATGFARPRILWLHMLPNAMVPIVTIVGMQFANVLTGTIVVENVFSLPGLGRLAFQAISNRDLPLVQALVVLFAAIVVIANFLVDLAYGFIDPKLRTGR